PYFRSSSLTDSQVATPVWYSLALGASDAWPGAALTTCFRVEAGFHLLWTQNQFAGSRRTAFSNARLISSMISLVERASPFTRVGISSPASMRQRARP